MVGRLVEQQNVRLTQRNLCEGHTRLLSSGEIPNRDRVCMAFQSISTQKISHYIKWNSRENDPGIAWLDRATVDIQQETHPSEARIEDRLQSHFIHEVLRVFADSELLITSNIAAQRRQIALN